MVVIGYLKSMAVKMQAFFTDWYFCHWAVAIVLLIAFLFWPRDFGFKSMFALAFGYTIISSMMVYFFGYSEENGTHPTVSMQIRDAALFGFVQTMFVILCTILNWNRLKGWLAWFWLFNVSLTIWCKWAGADFTGLGINSYHNSILLAIQFGWLMVYTDSIPKVIGGALLTLAAIAVSGNSMGALCFVAGTTSFCFCVDMNIKGIKKAIISSSLYALFLFIFFWALIGGDFTSLTGRDHIWSVMIEYMESKETWIFGSGHGTFSYLGPMIQRSLGWKGGYFFQAHSDIIQILFEQGVVGLLIWTGFFISALAHFYKKGKYEFVYLTAAIGTACIGGSPLRLPWTMFLFAGVLADGLIDGKKSEA